MQWNLAQLASALLAADLLTKEDAQAAIDEYGVRLVRLHGEGWAAKLGLSEYSEGVATRYMKLMAASESDFTNSFRVLTALSHEEAFLEVPASLLATCGKELSDEDKQVTIWRQTLVAVEAELWSTPRGGEGRGFPVYHMMECLLGTELASSCTEGCAASALVTSNLIPEIQHATCCVNARRCVVFILQFRLSLPRSMLHDLHMALQSMA